MSNLEEAYQESVRIIEFLIKYVNMLDILRYFLYYFANLVWKLKDVFKWLAYTKYRWTDQSNNTEHKLPM